MIRRLALSLAVAIVGAALTAASSQALTTVSYSPSSGLRIQGDAASEGAVVQLLSSGTSHQFRVLRQQATSPAGEVIPSATLVAGSGCSSLDGNVACDAPGNRVAAANLGGGADFLSGRFTEGMSDMFVNGGTGNDLLEGGTGFDALDGAAGNDRLSGFEGSDLLEGRDGDDRFSGDSSGFSPGGADTLRGGAGRDTLQASATAGSDKFDGGPGRDTADYSARTTRVSLSVTYGPGPNQQDGLPLVEVDDLTAVETLIGGSGDDFLRVINGFPDDPLPTHRLIGNAGNDLLRTLTVLGSLDGGLGRDHLHLSARGGAIAARDGEMDTFDCSTGTELITADLRDAEPPGLPDDCVPVSVGAVNEGPNVVFRSKRVRVNRSGVLLVRMRCPRRLSRPCRGRLAARLDRKGTPFGKRVRYSIRPGRSKTIKTRLRASQRGAARRRRARVRLESVEKGRHGPKTTTASLRTRRR